MQTRLDDSIIDAAARWSLDVQSIRKDIEICGSPERCEFRFVIECSDNDLYVMKSLIEDEINHKRKIISSLNCLFKRGLKGINPYIPSKDGAYIEKIDSRFWQISRFIDGVCLKRPEYVFDQWRGNILADFLIDLRHKSETMPGIDGKPPFSIINYINTLNDQIKTFEQDLYKKIQPVVDFLEKNFIRTHDNIPACFCHGDFHALNMIWSDTGINAVIDWEFSGIKPEIYDMANMIGCIGIENPEALAGPLVTDFIGRLKKSAMISDISWTVLVEFIIAIRFAWLSEWLRHKDHEMIDLEMIYIKLLIDNANDLKQIWKT
ncbi:MAG: phosphotransferase [Desulfobacteraceae bacterium]|nr:phosphotransferase [Desulfobacteraceae bacterium]MBC2757221.1 phosphotransferase [Desulfobacteraceae bacterium]